MPFTVRTPKILLPSVWPLPCSLATTYGISVDFFSSSYLDVSVQTVPLIYLFIQYMIHELHSCGLLHSDISGSMCACHSPELFAAYHVLHRLLMPRHPPCALISLNSLFAELCLVLKNHFLEEFYFFRRSLKLYFYPFFKVLPFLNWISYNFLFVVSLFNFQRSLSLSSL